MVEDVNNENGKIVGLAKNVSVEDEEEFRSCCEDENELREMEELVSEADDIDEHSVRMYFKGISVSGIEESGSGYSGIGVVMERAKNVSVIQVQKKLDFYVEESIANYLALIDGLAEAKQNDITKVFAFTDSRILNEQVLHGESLDNPLLMALKLRIAEHTSDLEAFTLDIVPASNLQTALELAMVAVGVISIPPKENGSTQSCSVCCSEKLTSMMMKLKCSHSFCSDCMRKYVEGKLKSAQVPMRCPQLKCKYYLSATECKAFLPVISYTCLEKALTEASIVNSDKIHCPYSDCSVLLDFHECLSSTESSSSDSENCCVECPVCQRFICLDCGVPWHSSTTCEVYQSLLEDSDSSDTTLQGLTQNKRWRRCQQCGRMNKLIHGSYHFTCWCGHKICSSCSMDYIDGEQACHCIYWDERYSQGSITQPPHQEYEQWAWDSFESFPSMMDAYSDQERSQLALIQRFLAGGFGLTDHVPDQSPPHHCTDSYADTLKDLHQLPWLERFVSVISDDYYEDYIQ